MADWGTMATTAAYGAAGLVGLAFLGKCFGPGKNWNARGKTIVIVGASSGIGAAVARAYASLGARLVLFARRRELLEQLRAECASLGAQKCTVVTGDVLVEDDVKDLFGSLESLDLLVLNAGVSMGQLFEECVDMEIFRKLMDLDYLSYVHCTQLALPLLKRSENGGRICVVSSLAGKFAVPGRTGYSGAKFALHGFFSGLRCELAPRYGTTITLICPGAVKTEINQARLVSGAEAASELSEKGAMSAEKAASLIVSAVAKGKREEIFTTSAKIMQHVQWWLPEVCDHAFVGVAKRTMNIDVMRGLSSN